MFRMQEKFLHAFNLVKDITYPALDKLSRFFGDWQFAWEKATESGFNRAGLSAELTEKILWARKKIDPIKEYEKLWEKDIFLITCKSAEFPDSLKNIPGPPFLLYRKGAALDKNFNRHVAMVGTRLPSVYGQKIALQLAEALAQAGGIIVSGLALGIDAISHFGAVKNCKPTVGVLASGIGRITPAANYNLARKILETGGTLLSEYASENVSYKSNFLERNRIISGLAKVTVVIEAKEKSGALITAHHALNQGRDIYALVGDINRPQAQGCLKLLTEGLAQPIYGIKDFMECAGFEMSDPENCLTGSEKLVLALIREMKNGSVDKSLLVEKSGLDIQTLNIILTKLEIKGLI